MWRSVMFCALAFVVGCSHLPKGGKRVRTSEPTENRVAPLDKRGFMSRVVDFESSPQRWVFKGDRAAVVIFYAPWCRPSKRIMPLLEELSAEYAGRVDFYKVDVDTERDLAAEFAIGQVPTLIFIPLQDDPRFAKGAMSKPELKQRIEALLL